MSSMITPMYGKASVMISQSLDNLVLFFGGSTSQPAIVGIPQSGIIGNANDAAIAQILYDNKQSYDRHDNEYPGWHAIGSGCYRIVFQAPDGIVYKVQSDQDVREGNNYNSNANELRNYELLAPHLPINIRLARCYKWSDTVNATEYVDCSGRNAPHNSYDLLRDVERLARVHIPAFGQYDAGFSDVANHPGNYGWTHDGILVVVDYAQ